MQLDIAREVTTGIVGTLTPVERAIVAALPTANAAAYEHYLTGNGYLGRRGQWLTRAVEEYRAAIKLDPSFDAPRAGMVIADVSSLDQSQGSLLGLSPPALLALIDSVIQRSPSVAMAWIARGVALRRALRLADARQSLERAVALEPNSVEAHYRMAQLVVLTGQFAEGRVSLERALTLDPSRAVTYQLLGVVAYFERRLPDAARMLDSALKLDPEYQLAMSWRVVVLTAAGDTSGTRKAVEANLRLFPRSLAARTRLDSARTLLDSTTTINMVLHGLPQALALVQRFDEALSQLGTPASYQSGNNVCRAMVADPAFDPVRRDPRFVQFETACLALREGG
jgi:adenylate cyclase